MEIKTGKAKKTESLPKKEEMEGEIRNRVGVGGEEEYCTIDNAISNTEHFNTFLLSNIILFPNVAK